MEEEYLRKLLNPSPNNNNPYRDKSGSSFAGILAPVITKIMLEGHGKNPVTDAFQSLLNFTINARDPETGKGFNISPGSVNFSLGDFNFGVTADKNNPGVHFRFNFTEPPKPQNTNPFIPGNEPNQNIGQEKLNALIKNDLNRFSNPSLPSDLFDRLRESYPYFDPYYRSR
jgi:hypothetical protein